MKLRLLLLSLLAITASATKSQAQCTIFTNVSNPTACGIVCVATGIGATGYIWDFGDASSAVGPTATHTYAGNGTYQVCCIGLDTTGSPCDSSCTTVTITGCNAASCTIVGTQIPNGPCSFTFIASGTAVAYSWTFGDSQSATGATVQHTYAGNGTYQVCVVGYDTQGMPCDTFCMTASVTNCTSSSCTIVGTQIPNGPCSYTFIASGLGVTSYTWTFGDSGTGTGATVQHTYAANGTYNVCVVGYDSSMVPCDTFCTTVTLTGCVSGIDEYEATEIALYPNPVNQTLNVKLEDQSIGTNWSITDISGRVVLAGVSTSALFTINTSQLPEGSYLMLFYGENNSLVGVRQLVKSE